ncbi:MAG: SPOR domain-containing protein [Bacteroidales bacterium]
MKNIHKLLTLILSLGVINFSVASEVNLKLEVSEQVKAGEVIEVKLIIDKGDLTGFARFHQDLPNGFVAEQVGLSSTDYVFSFADQRLRIIWANLPDTSVVEVNYRIRVDEANPSGDLVLAGRFTYLNGDERLAKDIESLPIKIADIPALPTGMPSETHTEKYTQFSSHVATAPSEDEEDEVVSLSVVRQKPYFVGNEYYVNLSLTKGDIKGSGLLEEDIFSSASRIEAVETKGALFSYANNRVTFEWTQLPAEQEFVISYKVIPLTQDASPSIRGFFSTISSGSETKGKVEVVEREIDFSNRLPVPLLAEAEIQQPSFEKAPPVETKPTVVQRGLGFKVQILATRKSIGNQSNINLFFDKYRLKYKITEEVQDFDASQFKYKYVVGPFKTYDQAKDIRDRMWARGIVDAFVTCYYNGERITVQEALLISSRRR